MRVKHIVSEISIHEKPCALDCLLLIIFYSYTGDILR